MHPPLVASPFGMILMLNLTLEAKATFRQTLI